MNASQEKILLHPVWIAEMIPDRVVAVLRTWRRSSHAKDSRRDRKRLGANWAALSATTTALDCLPPYLLLCNKNKHKHLGHYLLDLLAWSWIYIYLIHFPHHLPEPLVFPQTAEDTYPRLTLSTTKHPMFTLLESRAPCSPQVGLRTSGLGEKVWIKPFCLLAASWRAGWS